jgi:hypothetical protein
MEGATPFRQHYLEHLNIRARGIENWVLAERGTLWRRAGFVFLGALSFVGLGSYFIAQCEIGRCTTGNEIGGILSMMSAGVVVIILLLFLVPAALARWLHHHRRAEWELEFAPRLDELERRFANRLDAPSPTREVRDLFEQTLAGDFLGERFAVRGNFWSGLARLLWIPAAVLVAIGLLVSGDAEVAIVFGLIALPLLAGGLVCRALGKKSHALAKKATDQHLATVREAMSKDLELPAPSFRPYSRGGTGAPGNPTR